MEALLAAHFEQPVVHDHDGDIPIRSGSAMVFVRISADLPIVELFSPLLLGVAGDALALERLNRVNRSLRFARLTWSRGTVLAGHEIWCEPFVPELLMRAVEMMMELADQLDDGLRAELGGRGFFEDGEVGAAPAVEAVADPDALHPALATIVQLTPTGDELTATQAARICGFERDLVLTLITDADAQGIEWRKSAADAEGPAEVAACEHEAAAWDKTAALLREALREIVLP